MSKILDTLNRDDFTQEELAKTFFTPSAKKRKKRKFRPKARWVILGIFVVLTCAIIGHRLLKEKEIFFIKDGEVDDRFVKDVYYFGDAAGFREKDGTFVLLNSRGSGWANFGLVLKKPVNMRKRRISYSARGKFGDERLVIILVDSENRTYRIKKAPLRPVADEWQYYAIDPIAAKGAVDISAISMIKFEFGGLTAGNYPAATIFIKDIYLIEREV